MAEISEGNDTRIRVAPKIGREQTVRVPKFIRDIPAIPEQEGITIRTRDDLPKIVELPLLPAAQLLYDLNIETVASSANKQDVGGFATLTLNFDSLSSENQRIALELLGMPYRGRKSIITGEYGPRRIQIKIPIVNNSTEQEIARKSVEIARKFKKQEMTWAPTFSPEEVAGREKEYYYDKDSGRYYLSKEHYLKVRGLSLKVDPK